MPRDSLSSCDTLQVGEDGYSQYGYRVNQGNFTNDNSGQYVNSVIKTGDRIGIDLNLDKRTCGFWHNDEDLG
jgi:hypothetical protein